MLKFGWQAMFSLNTHFIPIPRPIKRSIVGAQSHRSPLGHRLEQLLQLINQELVGKHLFYFNLILKNTMLCYFISLHFVCNGLVINILKYKYWLQGANYSEDAILISFSKLALEVVETFIQGNCHGS